ncbi:histidine kinase [Actinoallomurus bryophytorum]|uniref:histidine kinase n=1 Tax=Actinoallomurus bryophytorum TaxID=1490222 RepID=A0A543BZB9_9ACTN|nr:histidine kinase [Actinoallomurus bryophytorum]TQL90167.1 histidine kinase [Actinoallomurus bryophytorum]
MNTRPVATFARTSARVLGRARGRIADAAWFGVSVLIAVGLVGSQLRSATSSLAEVADTAAAAAACLALWWRRRWPVPIAVVLGVLTCLTPAAQVPALVCLGTVASRRPVRPLIAVALVLVAATVTRYVDELSVPRFTLKISSERGDGNGAVNSALLLVIVIAWGLYIRARRQLVASLRERADKAEAEQRLRIEQARSGERARIAREMHDVLAHRISLISLQAGALQVSRRQDDAVAESAALIRTSAHQALEDLRGVIGVLRAGENETSPLVPQPTLADLRRLVEESVRAGMAVSLHEDPGDAYGDVPAHVGRTAYRVVQEGLTNARKHAPGAAVTVRASLGTGLDVEVRNPRGTARADLASPIPGAGQGLVGLSERARLVGGRLEYGWTAKDEFRLAAWLPLRE